MPYFRQFPNACGLTSLLMVLKPASRQIDAILNFGWEKIGKIFPENSKEVPEFRWQHVLEYLLTASTQHPALRAYLLKKYPEFSENILPWLEFALLQGKVPQPSAPRPPLLLAPQLIMRRVRTMKHDIELKLLAFLFGCRFVPWKNAVDGTGAAFFSRDELNNWRKGGTDSPVPEKLIFIKEGLDNGGPVLWGASFHWLAAKSLEEREGRHVLFYHDPMGGREHTVNIGDLHESDRFYVFRFDPTLLKSHVPLIKEVFALPEDNSNENKESHAKKGLR